MTTDPLTIIFGAALISIAVAALLAKNILQKSEGDDKTQQISGAIREGAHAYLRRQTTVIIVVTAILALLLLYIFTPQIAFGFVYGATTAAIAGFLGMGMAVRSSSRTAHSAEKGLDNALKTAFRSSAVLGLLMEGLALFTIISFFVITNQDPFALVGVAFGAGLTAIFARIGGGIYTQGAAVGACLVGSVEKGLSQNDPRNPGVIADRVGDNVGDGAGMLVDLFQSYIVGITGATLVGIAIFPHFENALLYPLALASVGAASSVIGTFFVRRSRKKRIEIALYKAIASTMILAAGGFYVVTTILMSENNLYHTNDLYAAALTGLVAVGAFLFAAEYFTSSRLSSVQHLANVSDEGHGFNIITGLALSMKSSLVMSLILVATVMIATNFAGVYGIAIVTVTMLSLAGTIAAVEAYVPITKNAASIAKMADMSPDSQEVTAILKKSSQSAKTLSKVYATSAASIVALCVFVAFMLHVNNIENAKSLTLAEPNVLIGLLIGAALPFFFAALTLEAVGKTAYSIVGEIRRQFSTIEGLREGKATPQYGAAVDIATKAALTQMIFPALIPVLVPLIVGTQMGLTALSALVLGTIISGSLLAYTLTTGGAAWKSAQGLVTHDSPGYSAAQTGGIVGDAFRDTAGPALSPMIKIVAVIAMLLAPLFI